MAETPDFGTDSTGKCNAIIDVSILSTSDEHQRQSRIRKKKTGSKRAGSDTSDSSEKRDPLPLYLVTDLNRLTFRCGENAYQADDTDHTEEWSQFASEHAHVPPDIDWTDLEERAHFLNALYAYCSSKGKSFPLDEQAENFSEKA